MANHTVSTNTNNSNKIAQDKTNKKQQNKENGSAKIFYTQI
jgi:hypothetical protein